MEQIKITEIKKIERPNKTTFWGCKDSAGRDLTVWNEVIAKDIENNLNKTASALVVGAGDRFNIRGFQPIEQEFKTANKLEEKPKLYSQKDISIIAQCMVKAVLGQPINFAQDVATIEKAVEMYKKAVKLLE